MMKDLSMKMKAIRSPKACLCAKTFTAADSESRLNNLRENFSDQSQSTVHETTNVIAVKISTMI